MQISEAKQINSKPSVLARRGFWINAALTALVCAGAGGLIGWSMPHGPATAGQALIVMAAGLALGTAAGLLMRSRWAALLAPLAHIAAIEITRLGAAGPTVDAIRLDETFGILGLILGRGFHGLVGLLPMVYAALLAAAYLRRGEAARARRAAGWMMPALGGLLLAALAVLIALPASTRPLTGPDGQPVPGSIAELSTVRLGGQEQAIMVLAHSPEKPVLLYLSGGPGQSDLAYSRLFYADLAKDFVVVCWDQRGTGKSYAAIDPAADLTLEQAVADTVALSDYLRERFDEQKIYLLGESWGSTLAVLAAQRAPDRYYAVIGSGQMVSQRETDRRLYHDVLALAEKNGDKALAEKMQSYGEPPYADTPYANAFVMGYYEALYQPYTPPQSYIQTGTAANIGPYGIFAREYNLVEKVNVLRGLLDMFSIMYPQLQEIDFRADVPRLEVPLYVFDGEAELTARRDLALEWFQMVQAPHKQMFSFTNAGHSVVMEQYVEFTKIMTDTILPQTYPKQP